MAKQIAAPATTPLTAEQIESVDRFAIKFAEAEATAVGAVRGIAELLGLNPSYTLWNAVAAQFKTTYKAKRKSGDEATDRAWVRFAARLSEECGLDKPKADSAASAKKAKTASSREAKREEARAQYAPNATTARAVQEVIRAKAAEIPAAALVRLQETAEAFKKAEDAAGAKAKREHVAELRAALREAIAKCEDEAAMQAALDVLRGDVEVSYAEAA
jgi:hypothetical protein